MKRRIAIVMGLLAVVFLLPMGVFAATHSHPMCGQTCGCSETMGQTHSAATWTAWNGSGNLSSTYTYLTQDATLTNTIDIYSGTKYLCLNGHTLTGDGADPMFFIDQGAKLVLCDCAGDGKLVGNDSLVILNNNGTFTMYGGTIECSGSGIENYKSVYLYGGTVKGTYAAVKAYAGFVTVWGAEVGTENSTYGIYMNASDSSNAVNVIKGLIKGRTGIRNDSGDLDLQGGTVRGSDYGIEAGGSTYISGTSSVNNMLIKAKEKVFARSKSGSDIYAGNPIECYPNTNMSGVMVSGLTTPALKELFVCNPADRSYRIKYQDTDMICERAKASGQCGGSLWWRYYENGDMYIDGTGAMQDYSSKYAMPWYSSYSSKIKHVFIESGVTRVGDHAFDSHYALTGVTFGNQGALTLGNYAFNYCTALTDIEFPADGTIIPGSSVFSDCDALTSVNIPASVKMNGSYSGDGSGNQLFYSCDNLSSATVECDYIGPFVFESDYNLRTVEFRNQDTEFYFLDNNGSGHPFHSNGGQIEVNIIGYDCSKAHRLAEINQYNSTFTFTALSGSAASHSGGTATCIQKAVCERCGMEYGDLAEHTPGDISEENRIEATCAQAGSYENVRRCTVCQEIVESESVVIPATGAHIYGNWEFTQEPTCEAPGIKQRTCTVCMTSVETEEVPALEHTYGTSVVDPTCTQPGYTLHVCSNCGDTFTDTETAATGHSFSEWETVTAATCMDFGSEKRVCSKCGCTETRGIDKAAHNWESDYSLDVAPTCTVDGSESIKCANEGCEAVLSSRVIPASGHQFGDWTITQEATCTTDGKQKHSCTVPGCGFEEEIIVPSPGHRLEEDFTIDINPTCTEPGSKSVHCAYCSEKKYEEVIPAAGHKNVSKVKKAQIGIAGKSWSECSVCGAITGTKTLAALKPVTTKIKTITAKSKRITVKWAKKKYTGYQIRYSTKRSMASSKTVTIAKATTSKKTIKKLKAKKKYYVQIRTYKTVNGKKCFSVWSKKKAIRTK